MQKNDIVSIIITCHNYASFLKESIESALSQSYPHTEIIVIDDGSTDNSYEVCRSYKNKIKYYFHLKGGQSKAKNFGLTKARGEYVLFLDADNKIECDYVSQAIGLLKIDDNISFIYPQLHYFGLIEGQSKFKNYDVNKLKYKNYIDTCSIIRKSVFKYIKFDESLKYLEDWDLYLSLSERGYVGKLLDIPMVNYRVHGDSVTDKYNRIKITEKRFTNIKIFVKHWRMYNPIFLLRWIAGHYLITVIEIINHSLITLIPESNNE